MIVMDNLAEAPRNAQPPVPIGEGCVWRVLVRNGGRPKDVPGAGLSHGFVSDAVIAPLDLRKSGYPRTLRDGRELFLKAEGDSPRDCNADEPFVIVGASKGGQPSQGGAGPMRPGAGLERRGGVCEVGEYAAELGEVLMDVVHRVGEGAHEGFIRPVERSG